MPHFNKRIEFQGTYLTFYFNPIANAGQTTYHVTVVDKNKKAQMFSMIENKGNWQLQYPDTCTPWIVDMETELASLIAEHSLKLSTS